MKGKLQIHKVFVGKVRSRKAEQEIKERKNFFPTLILTFFLWIITVVFIYFVDPDTFGAVPLFFLLIFFALLFTFSTLFANTRRGLITSGSLTIFLILHYFGIGNIINFVLISGLAVAIEVYFSKN